MRRLALIALAVLALATPAGAQATGPILGSPATAGDQVTPITNLKQLLMIGDALGGGLGAGLTRYAEAHGGYEVTNRFVEESGIARPEVYDWSATLPKILEGKDYDTIVVLLGANDRQMIKQGNLRFGFDAPEWSATYSENLNRFLDELKASGAEVFWVSLPPMADAAYDDAMRKIAALQKQRVEAHGMHYLDLRASFTAADGSYTDSGPDDTGEVRKLRSRDGVTFFKQGNNRMAQLVMQAIATAKPSAETAPPVAEAAPEAARPKLEVPTVDVPLFGQANVAGDAITLKPVQVAESRVSASTQSFQVVSGSFADVLALVPPGSSAARLFTDGVMPKTPAGRIDDFAAAPKP